MKQVAKLKYLKITPRKVRLVGNLLKGLSVNEAEAQLLYERRRAAKPLLKLLRAAVQNAKAAKHLDSEKLFIESLRIDEGPRLKRYLPRARGIATPIHKKMSHVTLVLAENPKITNPRFTIMVPKKIKLPAGEKVKEKKRKKQEPSVTTIPQKKGGFWKRIFRRKAI
jgi:large subunit ribosomal protein L22